MNGPFNPRHSPTISPASTTFAPKVCRWPCCSLLPMGLAPLLAQQIVAPSRGYYLEIPLVIGLAGLVVFAICRSSRRQERAFPVGGQASRNAISAGRPIYGRGKL